ENGMGITMKICHNALVAEIQNGVNETLGLAQKLGISIDDFVTAVSYGGAGNFYLESQKENLKAGNWTAAFSLENEHKDLGIAQRLAQQKELKLPGLENCKAVYDKGMQAGMGKEDFRATYKIVNGIGD
ncbi:MAG: NAD(P)-dependent oxidoreductase, partial [Clostridia bacterium]|nr:NAD(P)-dependent oxidoreductase [Clostridia bacterium]